MATGFHCFYVLVGVIAFLICLAWLAEENIVDLSTIYTPAIDQPTIARLQTYIYASKRCNSSRAFYHISTSRALSVILCSYHSLTPVCRLRPVLSTQTTYCVYQNSRL